MDKRLKDIENFVNQTKSQEKWQSELNKKIYKWKSEYEKELEDYIFIESEVDLKSTAKKGGYIRYFNANDELRYGGFLVNIFEDNEITKITLMNTMGKRWVVSWTRNYIFYKKHTTANDKLRKIFISLLE
jgi:hypothetical protein